MRLLASVLWVSAMVVFLIVGCNEVTTPATAPWQFAVTANSGSEPWEGIRLCELDTDNCVWSSANGNATLMLPVGQETGYTADGGGAAPWLLPFIMPAEGNSGTLKLLTEQYIAEMHSRVMSPYPMRGTGAVWVIFDPPLAGATVELDAATGVRFYLDEESNWYPDLTATTARGRGGFTEVTPGEVQVNVGGTADNCSIAFGWPSHGENSVRLPVREGYVTAVNMRCTTHTEVQP